MACASPEAVVETVSGGVMDAGPPRGGGRGQAASVHIRSGGHDRQAKCATARRCGRMAAECTCTAREFGRCARPTVRPGRNVNDDRDHGDGSDTRPRGRRTSGSLTETRVRAWQYWPERFDGSADRNMNPCPLDGTDQLARTVLAAGVEPDGPVDADGDQARVIDDARHPAFLPGGGGGTAVGRGHRGASGRDPATATRCRPPGLHPSDGDAVVAGLVAGVKRVIGQGHGDDRIGRMAVPEQIIDPAVLVLAIEGVEPWQLEFVALQGRHVADEQVPVLAARHVEVDDVVQRDLLGDDRAPSGGIMGHGTGVSGANVVEDSDHDGPRALARARGGHELQRLHVTPERHHHGEIDGLCPVGSVGVAMRDRREGGHPPVDDRWNTACVEAGQP